MIIFLIIFFFIYIKISKNLSATQYQENKERVQKIACEGYQNLSKEKQKKSNSRLETVQNLSKDEKQKLVEYKKIL